MTLELAIQMIFTALMGVVAFSLNNMAKDIREIRDDIKHHIGDHAMHCKHPKQGC